MTKSYFKTVGELIEELKKFDPNMIVMGTCTDPTDYTYKTNIELEEGNQFDSNGYGFEIDNPDEKEVKVLLINLGEV